MQDLRNFLRKRGYRVNLRPLAEVQTLLWLPVLLGVLWMCWKLGALIWHLIATPNKEGPLPVAVDQPLPSSSHASAINTSTTSR